MKRVVTGIIAVIFWISNAAWANPVTDEERRLVSLAEEISTSDMDDDEKIARLTEVESRISRIRKNRSDSVGTQAATVNPLETPKVVRPLSTYMENQTRSTLEDSSDEDEPAWLSKFFFAAVRYVGITLAIGVAVGVFSLLYAEAIVYVERKFDWRAWWGIRSSVTPITPPPTSESPIVTMTNVPTVNTPTPIRRTPVRLVRKKPAVTRDGIVPPHLR